MTAVNSLRVGDPTPLAIDSLVCLLVTARNLPAVGTVSI